MRKQKIVSVIGLYAAYVLVGHHGPLSKHISDDSHPHTHNKHVIKLLKKEDDFDLLMKKIKYVPIST